MAYVKGQPFKPQFIDPNTGLMLSAGTIEFYAGDTTTPTPYYTDSTGTVGGTSLELDAGGKPPTDIFFDTGVTYKLVVKNGAGTPIETLFPFDVRGSIGPLSLDTLAAAISEGGLESGDILKIEERTEGNGGGGTWDVVLTSGVTPNGYNIVQSTADATLSLVLRTSKRLDAAQFGALGDGSDSADILQAMVSALPSSGGVIHLPLTNAGGDYRVSVTKGTNDKYGFYINKSKVTLSADSGVTLRRLDSDISTYSLAFPILFLGSPDDNSTQVSDLKLKGVDFTGEDTRHSSNGSALMDGRQAIWIKNCKGVRFNNCKFDQIDSGAVYVQSPSEYDYENSTYYNTTKSYNIKFISCDFEAEPHATAGRALIHAIHSKADNVKVSHCNFEWCDVGVSCGTTYDEYDDQESDTFTDPNIGSVMRTGRGYTINSNTFYNSSEHCLYLNAMGITASGNNVIVDNPAVCNTTQFQIRGRGVAVSGGTMTGVARAGSINTGAMDVSWTGTTINAVGDSSGGVVNISSQGLTSYIDNRSAYFQSYKPMQNIRVDVNINMPAETQTHGVGVRLYTDTSDANFPGGQMINVNLAGTTIRNAKKGVLVFANMLSGVKLDDLSLVGKPFTKANYGDQGTHDGSSNVAVLEDSAQSWTVDQFVGWRIKNLTDGSEGAITANTATTITATLSGGTDDDWDASDAYQLIPEQLSVAAIAVDDSLTSALQNVSVSDCNISGFEHLFYDDGEAGTLMALPFGIRGNSLSYIENFSTDNFKAPAIQNRFTENTGLRFLDRSRWFSTSALNNSLSNGASNSEFLSCMIVAGGTDLRYYTDDVGGYNSVTLS